MITLADAKKALSGADKGGYGTVPNTYLYVDGAGNNGFEHLDMDIRTLKSNISTLSSELDKLIAIKDKLTPDGYILCRHIDDRSSERVCAFASAQELVDILNAK